MLSLSSLSGVAVCHDCTCDGCQPQFNYTSNSSRSTDRSAWSQCHPQLEGNEIRNFESPFIGAVHHFRCVMGLLSTIRSGCYHQRRLHGASGRICRRIVFGHRCPQKLPRLQMGASFVLAESCHLPRSSRHRRDYQLDQCRLQVQLLLRLDPAAGIHRGPPSCHLPALKDSRTVSIYCPTIFSKSFTQRFSGSTS